MSGAGLEWVIKPSAVIGANLGRLAAGIEPAGNALAASYADRGEAMMKAGASWSDRTSNARQSLFGRAEGTTIILGGTAYYIVFLELGTSKMAAYPIIMPTTNEIAVLYFRDVAQLIAALLGG